MVTYTLQKQGGGRLRRALLGLRGDAEEAAGIMGAEAPGETIEVASLVEKAKFYTSLCLGTTAIVSVFAFLFLIPFVVDPAVSTIVADYEPEAVTCLATEHVYTEGLRNCSWASCREGCTTTAPRCHQILVNYSREPFAAAHARNFSPPPIWHVAHTRFYVNTEGCGYPPRVRYLEPHEHVHTERYFISS